MSSIVAFIASAIFSVAYNRAKKNREKVITVSELWIYPIKSCKGIKVSSVKVTRRGFENDRMMMIVDNNGKFVSQRSYPSLALVNTSIIITEGLLDSDVVELLRISAPNMDDLTLPISKRVNGPLVDVTIWGDLCRAYEIIQGSFWFRQYLNKEGLRLVRMDESFVRFTDPDYAPDGETSFSDGFPFLLASEESLDELNTHLDEKITLERFRPNIVVKGGDPYDEDEWRRIKFNGNEVVTMNVVKPCSRCTIPNIDPLTGIPHPDNQPSRAMKAIRAGKVIGLKNEKWAKQVRMSKLSSSCVKGDNMSIVGLLWSKSRSWRTRWRRSKRGLARDYFGNEL